MDLDLWIVIRKEKSFSYNHGNSVCREKNMLMERHLGNQDEPGYDRNFVAGNRALYKREYLMIFFLFLIETISCDPSSEPSRQDDSDEGWQHMFLCRLNKNYP